MELAKRDLAINKLNDEINKRKEYLNNKHKEIQVNAKDNTLLNDLLNEYDDYMLGGSHEKHAQIKALESMLEYIENMETNASKEIIESLKHDRKEIIRELNLLKKTTF